MSNYLAQYAEFISKLGATVHSIQTYQQETLSKYTKDQENSRIKAQKDSEFGPGAEEYLRLTTQNFIQSTKYMDELRAKMKEGLAKLEAKKVAEIAVEKSENLNFMFSSLYAIYYKESTDPFNWKKFKKEAILKDELDDFQSRLVNLDFSTLTENDLILLTKIKDDPWIEDFVVKKKEGGALIELINYIEFVNEAVKTQTELKKMQRDLDRIKKDIPNRVESVKVQTRQAELLKENIAHLVQTKATFDAGADAYKAEFQEIRRILEMCGHNTGPYGRK